jgi:hypothetical protein
LAQDLGKRFPLDTQMQSLWLPAIQAQLALDRKNLASALTALQAATPIELGTILFVNNISCLYPVYVHGEAYLAAGQGTPAAAEFQKISDHSGIVWNCWTGALAHLGVARANALQSRTSQGADADAARTRALAAYKDFLALWKDADPDIPILKQAKAEYAKLRSLLGYHVLADNRTRPWQEAQLASTRCGRSVWRCPAWRRAQPTGHPRSRFVENCWRACLLTTWLSRVRLWFALASTTAPNCSQPLPMFTT